MSGVLDLLLETPTAYVIIDHKTFPAKAASAWRAKCRGVHPAGGPVRDPARRRWREDRGGFVGASSRRRRNGRGGAGIGRWGVSECRAVGPEFARSGAAGDTCRLASESRLDGAHEGAEAPFSSGSWPGSRFTACGGGGRPRAHCAPRPSARRAPWRHRARERRRRGVAGNRRAMTVKTAIERAAKARYGTSPPAPSANTKTNSGTRMRRCPRRSERLRKSSRLGPIGTVG